MGGSRLWQQQVATGYNKTGYKKEGGKKTFSGGHDYFHRERSNVRGEWHEEEHLREQDPPDLLVKGRQWQQYMSGLIAVSEEQEEEATMCS